MATFSPAHPGAPSRAGHRASFSHRYKSFLAFSRTHFKLQRLFGALPARDADEGQATIDDRRRDGAYSMTIRQLLAVRCRDVDFPIRENVLHAELFSQALG